MIPPLQFSVKVSASLPYLYLPFEFFTEFSLTNCLLLHFFQQSSITMITFTSRNLNTLTAFFIIGIFINTLLITPSMGTFGWLMKQSDPDEFRDIYQVIESRGYKYEIHEVLTADDYILTLQRIINPLYDQKGYQNQTKKKPPVIMVHGFCLSAIDYLINSPGGTIDEPTDQVGNNLGFELSKRGSVFLFSSFLSLLKISPSFLLMKCINCIHYFCAALKNQNEIEFRSTVKLKQFSHFLFHPTFPFTQLCPLFSIFHYYHQSMQIRRLVG